MDRVQCHRFWQCNNLNWQTEKVFSILLSLSLWVYHNRIYTVFQNYHIKLLQNKKQAKSSNNACFLSAWFCVYLSVCALTIKIQNWIVKIDIYMKFGNLVPSVSYNILYGVTISKQYNLLFQNGGHYFSEGWYLRKHYNFNYYLLQFKWIFTRNMSCNIHQLHYIYPPKCLFHVKNF